MGTVVVTGFGAVISLVGGRAPDGASAGWAQRDISIAYIGSADSNLLAGIISPSSLMLGEDTGTYSLVLGWDQGTPVFKLDGGLAVSFNGLPSGFFFTALTLILTLNQAPGVLNVRQPGTITILGQTQAIPTGAGGTLTFNLITPGNSLSALDFILSQLTITVNGASGFLDWIFDAELLSISGTYGIFGYTYTLDTSVEPVGVGTEVTITSNSTATPVDFSHVSSAYISFIGNDGQSHQINITDILIQISTQFTFLIPDWLDLNPTTISIVIVGDGTQFSGSVTLGTLETIYFQGAAGIYTLVAGKTSDTQYLTSLVYATTSKLQFIDTLYEEEDDDSRFHLIRINNALMILNRDNGILELDSDVLENDVIALSSYVTGTQEVKILNPFIKTAFIP